MDNNAAASSLSSCLRVLNLALATGVNLMSSVLVVEFFMVLSDSWHKFEEGQLTEADYDALTRISSDGPDRALHPYASFVSVLS